MSKRRSAPEGCKWRGDTLYSNFTVRGQRVVRPLETDDPKLAKERSLALKKRLLGDLHGDGSRTFNEAFLEWDQWMLNRVGNKAISDNTRDRYLASLEQLDRFLDGRELGEINGQHVAQIIRSRQGDGVTNATIKRDLTALSSVLDFSIKQEWIEANPVLPKLALIEEARDPIVLPKHKHIDMVIDYVPGMMGDVVRAAVATGARQDELIRAKHSDIDRDRKQLTLIGKGNKLRVIDIEPFGCFDHLRSLPAHLKTPLLFWHHDGESYKHFASSFCERIEEVFLKAYDRKHGTAHAKLPYTKEGRAKRTAIYNELCEQQDRPGWVDIGFRPFRFHDLRHLHAVEFLKQRLGSIYDLQWRLGHTSVTTTEMYLEHLTADEKRAAKDIARVAVPRPRLVVAK